VGTASAPFPVTLANPGSSPVAVDAVGVSGPFDQTHDCPRMLAGGASCTVSVRFAPAGIGDHLSGELTVRTGAVTERLALEGRGVALEVTPWPGAVDFGTRRLDDPPETRTVTVGNTGSDFVEILGLGVSGATAASFAILEDRCTGRMLWLNEECTLVVAFAPERNGALAGALEIASTAAPTAVPLQGFGVDRAVLDIPTLGEWALLGLALLLALTGVALLGGRG
jgi:hypothetical protein